MYENNLSTPASQRDVAEDKKRGGAVELTSQQGAFQEARKYVWENASISARAVPYFYTRVIGKWSVIREVNLVDVRPADILQGGQ